MKQDRPFSKPHREKIDMLVLTLENFRRYREATTVQFPAGLTLISGENGAGKSTLTQALLQALFGKFKPEDVRSDGIEAGMRVTFQLHTPTFHLEATCSDQQHQVKVDGNTVVPFGARSKTAACEHVQNLLGGLGPKEFEKVYFALQGETHALISDPKMTLKHLIEQVLQLDVLKKSLALQQARCIQSRQQMLTEFAVLCERLRPFAPPALAGTLSKLNGARSPAKRQEYLEALWQHVHQGMKGHAETIQGIASALSQAEAEMHAHDQQVRHLEQDFAQISLSVKNWEDKQLALQELQKEQSKLIGSQHTLSEDLQRLETLLSEAKKHQVSHEAYLYHQERLRLNTEALSRFEHHRREVLAVQQAEDQLKRCQEQLEKFSHLPQQQQDLALLLHQLLAETEVLQQYPGEGPLTQLKADLKVLQHQKTELEQAFGLIDSADQVLCPTCGQPLDVHQRTEREGHLRDSLELNQQHQKHLEQLISNAQKEQQDRNIELQAAQQKGVELKAEKARLEERALHRNEAEQKFQQAEIHLAEARNHLHRTWGDERFDLTKGENLLQEQKNLKDSLEELQPLSDLYNRRFQIEEDLQNKTTALQDARLRLGALTTQIEQVKYDPEGHQESKQQQTQLQQTLQEGKVTQSELTARHQQISKDLEQSRDLQEKIGQAAGQTQAAQHKSLRDETLEHHLDQFQGQFFLSNSTMVLRRATQLIQPVLEGTLSKLELDASGTLSYRDVMGVNRSIQRLSGGEKALVGLCLRLALAERAQTLLTDGKVRFLVLDEVLSSLDDQKREQVQDILEDVLSRKVFDHIIMITHIDDVKLNWRAHRLEVQKTSETASQVFTV